MKIKCSFLFTIFIWRFEAGVRVWVGAWVEAPATIGIGCDQGRHLLNVSRPQGRHMNSYRSGETWCRTAASVLQL